MVVVLIVENQRANMPKLKRCKRCPRLSNSNNENGICSVCVEIQEIIAFIDNLNKQRGRKSPWN